MSNMKNKNRKNVAIKKVYKGDLERNFFTADTRSRKNMTYDDIFFL